MSRAQLYPRAIAGLITAGFFLLLAWMRIADVYTSHFYDRGPLISLYQFARALYIPYLFWLQYTPGAYLIYRLAGRKFPFTGATHIIASFLAGTSLWHILLLATGLAGLDIYPVMLLLAGGTMLASLPHMATLLLRIPRPRMSKDESVLVVLLVAAALLFILTRGIYPSGGHDFFNHYFTYYLGVIRDGHLGPNETWYQYFYSKGLGITFLSMILMDPLAIHPAATTFVIASAFMVYDLLRRPDRSRAWPLLGATLFFLCYIHTAGRSLFAANGGWGDLEKTHEINAVFLLGCVWLAAKACLARERIYSILLCLLSVALIIIFFASGVLAGLFYLMLLAYGLLRRDRFLAGTAFCAGAAMGAMMLIMCIINYLATGIPHDQLVKILWFMIDWQKVVRNGYSLELYSHLNDLLSYSRNALPLWQALPKMIVEFYRLYFLGPLFAVGAILFLSSLRAQRDNPSLSHRPEDGLPRRRCLLAMTVIAIFLLASLVFALFFGGRSQPISFFRYSTFNYAPTLIFALLIASVVSDKTLRITLRTIGAGGIATVIYLWFMPLPASAVAPVNDWIRMTRAGTALATGNYSLREAIGDQSGRVGRLKWGGIYPAMDAIYAGLPPKTRVWSIHNHSYCLLPACNVGQYFSQITSPRWYDIALGSVEEGKKILQEEGLNFIFYSRNVPIVNAADTKDQLSGFYKGLSPEHIEKTYGILWTNGWDYLLTWKEESVAPLDDAFMDSWRMYYENFVAKRHAIFPVDRMAPILKKAAEDPGVTHPPVPSW